MHKKLDSDLSEKIFDCIGLRLDINDDLFPKAICTFCFLKVEDLLDYREKCFKVQDMLWSMVQESAIKCLDNDSSNYVVSVVVANSAGDGQRGDHCLEITIVDVENSTVPSGVAEYVDESLDSSVSKNDVSIAPTGSNRQKLFDRKITDAKKIYKSLLVECKACGKAMEKARLDGHINRHRGITPYDCTEENCESKFHCKIALRLHRNNTHSKGRQACEMCKKTFKSKRHLYVHKQTIHNEATFKCTSCSACFPTSNQLKRHVIIHNDDWKYSCAMCSKKFYRKLNLTVHMRSHTKEKPFSCPLCFKSFGYKRVLKEHLLRVHNQTMENLEQALANGAWP
uniref:Protein krueppel n=1 Tax=Anopheles dirus TaxID=7168 RepID=A0A182N8R3_9DIPT